MVTRCSHGTVLQRLRPARLDGARVLLVEDDPMITLMLQTLLLAEGCRDVWCASEVDQALALLASERPDLAVLDVNIGACLVYPVADRLAADGTPWLFVTAVDAERIPQRFQQAPLLQKPCDIERVLQTAAGLLAPR